jgi:hypothetical protein
MKDISKAEVIPPMCVLNVIIAVNHAQMELDQINVKHVTIYSKDHSIQTMNVNVSKDFSIMVMMRIVKPAIHFAKIAVVTRIVIV